MYRPGIEGPSLLSRAAGALDVIQCSTLVIILFFLFFFFFSLFSSLCFSWGGLLSGQLSIIYSVLCDCGCEKCPAAPGNRINSAIRLDEQ